MVSPVIELRPAAPSQPHLGEVGPIIQALRFLGEANVNEEVMARLRDTLTESQREALRREWRGAPAWMQPLLREAAR